tara:strand:+ start:131 stop:277 length:147 start_codon:yes stop_codon:yes gene_type:complete
MHQKMTSGDIWQAIEERFRFLNEAFWCIRALPLMHLYRRKGFPAAHKF